MALTAGTIGLSACASSSGSRPGPTELNTSVANGDMAPLLDRALFFDNPAITDAELSPDGKFIAFIKPYQDVRNLWVAPVTDGGDTVPDLDQARPVTADTRPVPGYFWSRSSDYLLYVQDKDGDENFHVYAVDPAAPSQAATGVPPARNLTDIDGVRAVIYNVPRNAPGSILVGLNDRDPAYHDVYRVDIATGARSLVLRNKQNIGYFVYDQNANVRLAVKQRKGGAQDIMRIEESGDMVRIHESAATERVFPIQVHPDGRHVYLLSNKGENVDLLALELMDMQTGAVTQIDSDPEKQVDLENALFHPDTDELLATVYVGDRMRIYAHTADAQRDLERLRGKFPKHNLALDSMTTDMRLWLVTASSDVDPGSTYLYHRERGTIELLFRSRPDLPSEHLAPMQPVRYQARDGLDIPAYLTLPKGVAAKNLPVVIQPHGGPWWRNTWSYHSYAQFLANRGYAVLQPNFRASTGYGKQFLIAGDREWGTGAMQHDISDGVAWLVEQGIADPERVCIMGGSYGGYATLAGVTFTPDLYSCGIPIVAPSSLITLIESFPAYWRPFLEGTWFRAVGDPAVETERRDLKARSPLYHVDQINVPLLVVHGANDPRVKQAESDQIVAALRDKGQPVEYIVAPDEGHGFRAPLNNKALAVAVERFLAKHLGGRTQAEVPAEVNERLAAITVDVQSVKTPTRDEQAAAQTLLNQAMTEALPALDGDALRPAVLRYQAQIQVGGQVVEMQIARHIEAVKAKGKQLWRLRDEVKTPMGDAVDTMDLDGKSLRPLERTFSGMAEGAARYSDSAVSGNMRAMGQETAIHIPLQADVIGDGPGWPASIATLPLSEGYHVLLRQVSMQSQKVQAYHLTVTGSERVQVAAGSFDTWVVNIEPLGDADGGGTTWLMKERPHHVIKSNQVLPATMGGGTMQIQLTSAK